MIFILLYLVYLFVLFFLLRAWVVVDLRNNIVELYSKDLLIELGHINNTLKLNQVPTTLELQLLNERWDTFQTVGYMEQICKFWKFPKSFWSSADYEFILGLGENRLDELQN